jgi:hypothetical protein
VPRVVFGELFYFMQSRILAVPAGVKARTLFEFRDALERIDASAVYYHVFDAMARKGKRRSDFTIWIEDSLGMRELASRFTALNPYASSLEGLRGRLVKLCEAAEREKS